METITETIYSHLRYRLQGSIAEDICENFATDVVILSSLGRFYGHDGVRTSAGLLADDISDGSFSYRQTLIEANYAFLEWTAITPEEEVCDGADSFVVKDGEIVLQTIHYTVTPRED